MQVSPPLRNFNLLLVTPYKLGDQFLCQDKFSYICKCHQLVPWFGPRANQGEGGVKLRISPRGGEFNKTKSLGWSSSQRKSPWYLPHLVAPVLICILGGNEGGGGGCDLFIKTVSRDNKTTVELISLSGHEKNWWKIPYSMLLLKRQHLHTRLNHSLWQRKG